MLDNSTAITFYSLSNFSKIMRSYTMLQSIVKIAMKVFNKIGTTDCGTKNTRHQTILKANLEHKVLRCAKIQIVLQA